MGRGPPRPLHRRGAGATESLGPGPGGTGRQWAAPGQGRCAEDPSRWACRKCPKAGQSSVSWQWAAACLCPETGREAGPQVPLLGLPTFRKPSCPPLHPYLSQGSTPDRCAPRVHHHLGEWSPGAGWWSPRLPGLCHVAWSAELPCGCWIKARWTVNSKKAGTLGTVTAALLTPCSGPSA